MGKRVFKHPRSWQLALAVSAALHLIVALTVGQMRWTSTSIPAKKEILVAWLYERPLPQASLIDATPIEPSETAPLREYEPDPIIEQPPIADVSTEPASDSISEEVDSPPQPESLPRPALERFVPAIDWEAAQERAVFHLREDLARTETYLTFSYPEQSPMPTLFGDGYAVRIAGIEVRPRPSPCASSRGWFLARILLPRDICDWRKTRVDSPLSEAQQAALVLPALPTSSSYVDRSIYGRP